MATNLEKLKSEIAKMSAEEFVQKMIYFLEDMGEPYCHGGCPDNPPCDKCRVRWLNSESEEKE